MKKLLIACLAALSIFGTASADTQASRRSTHAQSARMHLVKPLKAAPKIKIPTRKSQRNVAAGLSWREPIRLNQGLRPMRSPMHRASVTANAYAGVVYSQKWNETETYNPGIYEIPTSGTPENIYQVNDNPNLSPNAGALYTPGRYFTAVADTQMDEIVEMTYNIFNPDTWQLISQTSGDLDFFALDMAWDPVGEIAYGCFINSEEQYYYFGSFDINTLTVTEIANWNVDIAIYGMACAIDGTLYGVDEEGKLYNINKRNGEVSLIGDTGIYNQYLTSATIDPRTGKMYHAQSTDAGGFMWEIDTTTGKADMVYQFPWDEEVTGMFIPIVDLVGAAPSAPTTFDVNFANGSLTGMVTFTIPTLTNSNLPLSGEINYRVLINGVDAATGSANPGQKVTELITAPKSGEFSVAVVCSNAAGQGPVVNTRLFIGHDAPQSVTNVTLTYADGQFVLTWDAPKSLNGGYLNPDNVTYRIERCPGEVVVATEFKGTTFTEPMAEPEGQVKYYYNVTPTYEGVTAPTVSSNLYALGAIVPPFRCDFNSMFDLEDFTIIDNNNDGKTWEFIKDHVAITYNSTLAADDYLVLPPMRLEAGKTYCLSFDVATLMDYPEKVAAYVGTSPTPEGLSTCLLRPTAITSTTAATREVYYVPEKSGTYFFAIHGCSDPDRYYLIIDNVSVSAPLEANGPAAPANFVLTPGAKGALSATLSFTLPTLTISGNQVGDITKVEITRNGKIVAELNGTAGQSMTWVDNQPENGINNYAVAAWNASGRGQEAQAAAYIGVYEPKPVESLTAMRGVNPGEVFLGWDAVTEDVNGNPLRSSQVTYTILRSFNNSVEEVATGLTGNGYSEQVIADDAPQQFVYYAVLPVTAGGIGESTMSDLVPVGKAYDVPYNESYANGRMSHIFGIDMDPNQQTDWVIGNNNTLQGISAQDGDNGYMLFVCYWTDSWANVYSGYINLGREKASELTFYYYNYASDNKFEVQINAGQGFRTVRTITLSADEPEGWTKVSINLSAYMGREIQYALLATGINTQFIAFDNFRVGPTLERNLIVDNFVAPARVQAGEKVMLNLTVKNDGTLDAGEYTVNLRRNGQLIESRKGQNLPAGTRETMQFEDATTPAFSPLLTYQADIVYDGDQNEADNLSAEQTVELLFTTYPIPTGLVAASTADGVILSWDEPDLDNPANNRVVDGVEDYVPFSIGLPGSELTPDRIGDWVMVDVDGLTTYGITDGSGNDVVFPNTTAAMAFQVFSAPAIDFTASAWQAYAGENMFICMAAEPSDAAPKKGNDDWMISPELYGDAQTIEFMAKSVSTAYGQDLFTVLWSDGSTNPEDFVPVGETVSTTNAWTAYSFDLPQGAKRFAIRCTSFDTFAFCIDNISYIAARGGASELSLMGFNVYRNGDKINDAAVEEPTYTDATVPEGTHTYHVTALYTVGESAASAPATVSYNSGIEGMMADGASSVKVEAVGGAIVVHGLQVGAVSIYTSDGRLRARGTAMGGTSLSFPLEAGIYVVSLPDATVKVTL